jgi:acetyl esterase/lipase
MRRRPGVTTVRNIVFGEGSTRKGKVVRLRLDVVKPHDAKPGDRRPGILQIHGGAWVIGDKREQGIPFLNHLAANGWVGINANYRLSPKVGYPEHLIDCKRAIAWWREHADEHGGDPDFLCVTGGSAGGHLTALVGLTAGDARFQPGFEEVDTSMRAAVPFYGVYDFTNRDGTWHKDTVKRFLEPMVMHRKLADDPDAFAAYSPMDQVRRDAPPFLVIHGSLDTLAPVADAREFVRRLRDVSEAPVLYAEMAGAQHAFEIFPSFRTARVIEGAERFLHSIHNAYLQGRTDGEVTDAEAAGELVAEPDGETTETPAGRHI